MSETDAAVRSAPDAQVVVDAHVPTDAGTLAEASPILDPDAGSPALDPDAGSPPLDPDAGPPRIDAGPPDTRASSARHTPRPRGTTAAALGY